jgi:hypothetical protein
VWSSSTACEYPQRCCDRDHREGRCTAESSLAALARSRFFDHAGVGCLEWWSLSGDRHLISVQRSLIF